MKLNGRLRLRLRNTEAELNKRLAKKKACIEESSDGFNVNIMITRWKEKSKQMLPRTCCYFDNCVEVYLSNISSSHTSQTYVSNQSICCMKLLFNNSVIKTSVTLIRGIFILGVFKA